MCSVLWFKGEVLEFCEGVCLGYMFGVFNIFFDILFKSGYFLLVDYFKVIFDCVNIDLYKFIICMCGFGVIVCIIGVVVLLCGVI